MKVLVINTVRFLVNGISSTIMEIYRNLRDDITFEFIVNEKLAKEYELEFKENGTAYFILPNRKKHLLKYRKSLCRILRENKYDIVHIHGNSSTMFIETSLKDLSNSKIIVHCHNIDTPYRLLNLILRPLFINSFDLALACSDEAGSFLYKDKPYIIIRNSVKCELYRFDPEKRRELREKLKIDDKKVILHVGRFNEQKNHKFLIEVIKKMDNLDDYIFVFIGDGDLAVKIKRKISELHFENNCLFLGTKKDIWNYYNIADLFVLPSLYESFGIVLLEAQINGLKCLCSSNIPRDIDFTGNVCFLDLDCCNWIDYLKNFDFNYKRNDYVVRAKEAGFSCENVTQNYKMVYEDILKQKEEL